MQIEIIPTILVKTFDEVKEKIKQVENLVDWVQLDIMDGVFVDNKTWNNPSDLRGFKTRVKLEAHLMVEKPEEVINDWLKIVDRVIVHYEAANNISEGKRIGLAINPETPIDVVKPFLNNLDLVLIMTVKPGWGGQKFQERTLDKIKALRKLWPDGNIEVDGGINAETAKKTIKAGANLICSGSYIFNSKDIKKAIETLK